MFTGRQITDQFVELGITHAVWLPDSTLGLWESELEQCSALRLIRVCREGEAWAIAGGLEIAGKKPIVLMQSTGLFESGDALRNIAFDMRIPVFAMIGLRNWLIQPSTDTAKTFVRPILDAWRIESCLISDPSQQAMLSDHYRRCQSARIPGFALLAEGHG